VPGLEGQPGGCSTWIVHRFSELCSCCISRKAAEVRKAQEPAAHPCGSDIPVKHCVIRVAKCRKAAEVRKARKGQKRNLPSAQPG
jgi:hypothetical protein